MSEKTQYLAASIEGAVLVAIHGRAVYTTCRDFGEFLEKIGSGVTKKLIIDMRDCTGVDSTVLGLIAGVAGDFKATGGEVIMQHCSGRISDVVENLGLPALLTLLHGDEEDALTSKIFSSGTTAYTASAPADGKTILHAHETLMAANPENAAKFKEVVDFMRSDVGL